MYTVREAAVLCWGKVRRAFLVSFRKHRVEENLRRRRGACTRCGACCKILFNCPAFDDSDGVPKCLIYNDRPGVCGLFPLDERDLRDRDLVMPGRPCGFSFADHPNGHGDGPRPEAMPQPIRWGPAREENDRPLRVTGTLAIIWAYFRRVRRRKR